MCTMIFCDIAYGCATAPMLLLVYLPVYRMPLLIFYPKTLTNETDN